MAAYDTDYFQQVLTWWLDEEVEISNIRYIPESMEECVSEDLIEFKLTMPANTGTFPFARAIITIEYIDWEMRFISCAVTAKEFDIIATSFIKPNRHSKNQQLRSS